MPHRLLRAVGIKTLWKQNAIFTAFCAAGLTLCAWRDNSFKIEDGYGYLQHPGILGWYLFQLVMPVAIYTTLKTATKSSKHYRDIVPDRAFKFREKVFDPIVAFVGFKTRASQALFAFLFTVGFAAFAWNSFQNLHPGELAPKDFWDSITFPFGYWGTRVYKFYTHALLIPSIVHVFAGVVWAHITVIRLLSRQRKVMLAPFNPDRCGGFGFLANLILSRTISALLISGLAFWGVIYTHRAFDIETVSGFLFQIIVLTVFYIIPTLELRSVLIKLKKRAAQEVHLRQEVHYKAVLSGELQGVQLREAHEYLRYFVDISAQINRIPNWPHFAKVSGVFGISISPALIITLLNFGNAVLRFYTNRR
ncbi:MAG: hypothetical protein ACJ8GN_18685 [Longimicrobiaceae bacterium]